MTERMNEEVYETKNIGNIYYLDINKVYRNPLNDEIYPGDSKKDIAGLKDDIAAKGLDSAITVVKDSEGNYIVLSGHGRCDSVKQMYKESLTLYHQGKKVEFGKIPCNIHPAFPSKEDEMEYIIACNGAKNGSQRNGKHVYDVVCKLYETKANRGDIDSDSKSLFQYAVEVMGIAKSTFYNYYNQDHPQDTKETITKIKKVSEVLKDIDKAFGFIKSIDMSEYGKTDKAVIKESLDKLIKEIKSKK